MFLSRSFPFLVLIECEVWCWRQGSFVMFVIFRHEKWLFILRTLGLRFIRSLEDPYRTEAEATLSYCFDLMTPNSNWLQRASRYQENPPLCTRSSRARLLFHCHQRKGIVRDIIPELNSLLDVYDCEPTSVEERSDTERVYQVDTSSLLACFGSAAQKCFSFSLHDRHWTRVPLHCHSWRRIHHCSGLWLDSSGLPSQLIWTDPDQSSILAMFPVMSWFMWCPWKRSGQQPYRVFRGLGPFPTHD